MRVRPADDTTAASLIAESVFQFPNLQRCQEQRIGAGKGADGRPDHFVVIGLAGASHGLGPRIGPRSDGVFRARVGEARRERFDCNRLRAQG